MLADKIKITDELIELIVCARKEHNLTAYQLSEKVGKNKSWLPNIENKRTKNISKEDLFLLLKDFAKEENMDVEEYVIRHISPKSTLELEKGSTVPASYFQDSTYMFHRKFSSQKSSASLDFEAELDRIQKEHDYRNSEIPYEVDYYVFQKILEQFNNTLLQLFNSLENSKERNNLTETLRIMDHNFLQNHPYTQKLYSVPISNLNPNKWGKKTNEIVAKEFEEMHKNLSNSISHIHDKADLYDYFQDEPHATKSIFCKIQKISQSTSIEEYISMTWEIDSFFYKLNFYISLLQYEYNEDTSGFSTEINPLLERISKELQNFSDNAGLSYKINFNLPDADATLKDIENKYAELKNIFGEIKKELHLKLA